MSYGGGYNKYLQSEDWKEKRKQKLSEQPSCEVCDGGKNLQVHHLIYRTLYNVKMSDLKVLCEDCHKFLHMSKDRGKDLRYEYIAQERRKKIEKIINKQRKTSKEFWENKSDLEKKVYEYYRCKDKGIKRFKKQKLKSDFEKGITFIGDFVVIRKDKYPEIEIQSKGVWDRGQLYRSIRNEDGTVREDAYLEVFNK